MELRRYRGRRDLAPLLAFCSAATIARAPLRPTWHPGDLVWQLRGRFDSAHALYAVVQDGAVVGALWFQGEELLIDLLPDETRLLPGLLETAMDKARRAGSRQLQSGVDDGDAERRAAFAAAGFSLAGPASVQFERDLAQPPAARPCVAGIHLRDCLGIDPEARAEVHRAAWSALEHLNIDATSPFSAADYLSLTASETYDPRFDIMAETADGRLVANATAWADKPSGTAVFEPVGVHPDFRGAGLTAAVMSEAMIRLATSGLRKARVGTAHFNTSAIKAYSKAFDNAGSASTWSREL